MPGVVSLNFSPGRNLPTTTISWIHISREGCRNFNDKERRRSTRKLEEHVAALEYLYAQWGSEQRNFLSSNIKVSCTIYGSLQIYPFLDVCTLWVLRVLSDEYALWVKELTAIYAEPCELVTEIEDS